MNPAKPDRKIRAEEAGDALDTYDALGLAELVRRREVKAEELLERAIARVEAVNPQINAVVAKHYDLARADVKARKLEGPFEGVPFLLKDLFVGLAGTVTTEGSVAFKSQVMDADTTIPARAKAAGMVVFGKTATPEFGLTVTTESTLFGATRNPWNLKHSAGGSSGGAAAAVAARILPIANATDGGGSIRIPASCCGVFGLKPSRGRVPSGVGKGIGWNGLSVLHAVSISVRDSAAMLDVLAGPEPGDSIVPPSPAGSFLDAAKARPKRLRMALIEAAPSGVPVHADCIAAVRAAAKLCESLGHTVEPASLALDAKALGDAMFATISVATAIRLDDRAKALGRALTDDEVEPVTRRTAEIGRTVSGATYSAARTVFDQAAVEVARLLSTYDVFLSPVLAAPPVVLGELGLSPPNVSEWGPKVTAYSPFTALANMTGVPAMSVPLHWNAAGLPIGVMFTAPFAREDVLFTLAAGLEEAQPWANRRPPVCA
jgi:Asp-tRNA(Asn)/Glu-tRNA(Gln) amidotransferase A subunit family amidase